MYTIATRPIKEPLPEVVYVSDGHDGLRCETYGYLHWSPAIAKGRLVVGEGDFKRGTATDPGAPKCTANEETALYPDYLSASC